MPRETIEVKARRYLAEGRLVVTDVRGPNIRAICRGDGVLYRLAVDPGARLCTCPARGRCAHLAALGLVTAVSAEEERR